MILLVFHTAGINGINEKKKKEEKKNTFGTEPKIGYCPFE